MEEQKQEQPVSNLGATLCKEFEAHRKYGQQWTSIWQACIDNFNPRQITVFDQYTQPGQFKLQPKSKVGVLANKVFGAGLFAYVCPNDREWAGYQEARPWLSDREDIKGFWQECTNLFRTHLSNSNFQDIGIQTMEGLGDIGTQIGMLERGKKTLFNFRIFPAGTTWIDVDSEGYVDKVYREFKLTPIAARDMWPKADLGPTVTKALEDPNPSKQTERFTFYHVCKPRLGRDKKRRDKQNMPFASYYIAEQDKHVIEEGGYTSFPYFAVRTRVQAPEIYGRSIGMDVLDEIEILNTMRTTKRKMAEISVNPDLIKKASMPYKVRRGGGRVTLADDIHNDVKEWETRSNFNIAQASIEDEADTVRRFFHNDLFELLSSRDTQMTAYEVGQRIREKLETISPVVGRIQNEFLQPILRRALDIMNNEGMLPEPPADVEPLQYKVIFSNRVSIAQQSIDNDSIMQGMEMVGMMAQFDPTVLDRVKSDEALKDALENINFPMTAVASDEEVAEMRQARAQQATVAQASETANMGADTLNKLPPELREKLMAMGNE